jgi:predicted Co/Zn/Cd cation transporter (cation efflux family)
MEMIESIVWITTGFISTLVTMEVAWRLAKAQARKVSKLTAMEQDASIMNIIERLSILLTFGIPFQK